MMTGATRRHRKGLPRVVVLYRRLREGLSAKQRDQLTKLVYAMTDAAMELQNAAYDGELDDHPPAQTPRQLERSAK